MNIPASLQNVQQPISIMWFRRDLRAEENRALTEALKGSEKIVPLFIFDTNILQHLEPNDRRVSFIHDALQRLRKTFQEHGSDILVVHGKPKEVFNKLFASLPVRTIYTNRDYSAYALSRDEQVGVLAKSMGIRFKSFKDHVMFEPQEVLKKVGTPFLVFTPFSKAWKARLEEHPMDEIPPARLANLQSFTSQLPALEQLGFEDQHIDSTPPYIAPKLLKKYKENRDFPGIPGTSKISVHLRFGTYPITRAFRLGAEHSPKWFDELIWREFYQMVMYHFPESAKMELKAAYRRIPWRHDEEMFTLWTEGKTGYPLVDAGMRELKETGYMHNRVRMVVASFLVKHLLIDWRWGERYFARELLDYELASNVGGWQWATGSGCDGAPYFRVFNPTLQQERFDPDMKYIRKWVPEIDSAQYPAPIVEHSFGRDRALEVYGVALKN
ncbi:MAG: deoxyribodipyrimidine photo-lyase [Flavobacteriales bacterium]|nr:deoxyribodipyrimidine photo-lyase [Flavobacteriales bacterium]